MRNNFKSLILFLLAFSIASNLQSEPQNNPAEDKSVYRARKSRVFDAELTREMILEDFAKNDFTQSELEIAKKALELYDESTKHAIFFCHWFSQYADDDLYCHQSDSDTQNENEITENNVQERSITLESEESVDNDQISAQQQTQSALSTRSTMLRTIQANNTLLLNNNSQSVLDNTHEQAFAARNVARLIQSVIHNELYANKVSNISSLNNRNINITNHHNSLWLKMLYGYCHKTSNTTHNENIRGILIGYDKNLAPNKTIGVLVGFADTDIGYKREYTGSYGHQESIYTGAYGCVQTGKVLLSESLFITQNSYKDDIQTNNNLNTLGSKTKYHGMSCFNKLSANIILQKNEHIICPEIAIYCDYIEQKNRYYKLSHSTIRGGKIRDWYTTCSTGIRYTQTALNKIRPHIFLGYEFTLSRKIGNRTSDQASFIQSSPVNKDYFIINTQIDLLASNKTNLSIQYTGNYKKHNMLTGITLFCEHKF